MEFHILLVFFYLNLMLVATHVALPPELYWKMMLPNTPMPKAITELLIRGGSVVSTGHMAKPVYDDQSARIVEWGQSADTETLFDWQHAAEETAFDWQHAAVETSYFWPTELQDLFFLEEDLRPGTKKSLHFSKSKSAAPLLPRQITEPIPFSTDKMKEVLNKFSVKPKSKNAEIIDEAIRFCEAPAFEGEEKYCATSLESLVDFITSKLGKNVHAISTEVDNEIKLQNFSLKHGVKKLAEDKIIACHRVTYPYAVFLCHKLIMTSVYFVPLEGEDGARVNSIAVCHGDTSKWNPKHVAFEVLKVKPGTAPVCHFSPEDNVVWFPK